MKVTLYERRGFTLVEIMIVVVIIGLLAALAVPVWQKIRATSIRSTMDNDARQLAGAAQQYFGEYGVQSVDFTYAADGSITGALTVYLKFISKNYEGAGARTMTVADPFVLEHPVLGARQYNAEGRFLP